MALASLIKCQNNPCVPFREVDQTGVRYNIKLNVRVRLIGEKCLVTAGVGAVSVPEITVRVEARMINLVCKALCDPITMVQFHV